MKDELDTLFFFAAMLQQTPADQWIMTAYAFLQEKYKNRNIEPLSYLKFEIKENSVIVEADCTQIGSWLAQELWRRRGFLAERGFGLKVLTGGKVLGDLPPVSACASGDSNMISTLAADILDAAKSPWLERQVRGVLPNLQRIQSIQQNDGSVYLVSALSGDNNIIKAAFPFLGLDDVLATKDSSKLKGKAVSFAPTSYNPGDDNPIEIGKIRARVVREGRAEGYYTEAYEFKFAGIRYKMQAEYLTVESEDEAIVIVRNLDLIQKGGWIQRREELSN